MRLFFTCSAAGIASVVYVATAHAYGICSTGAYNTCVVCCKTNMAITNRELCTYQCGDYKILERQRKREKKG
jgi:predicted nucleic acid-binding Zn ribbon protein